MQVADSVRSSVVSLRKSVCSVQHDALLSCVAHGLVCGSTDVAGPRSMFNQPPRPKLRSWNMTERLLSITKHKISMTHLQYLTSQTGTQSSQIDKAANSIALQLRPVPPGAWRAHHQVMSAAVLGKQHLESRQYSHKQAAAAVLSKGPQATNQIY